MTLQAVPNDPDGRSESDRLPPGIPTFEGKQVHTTQLVVKGVNKLECDDRVLRLDSIVRLAVEARVTDVRLEVDERDGTLRRTQVVKAIEVEFLPWGEDDDGVLT